jgi:hypothetical protein
MAQLQPGAPDRVRHDGIAGGLPTVSPNCVTQPTTALVEPVEAITVTRIFEGLAAG